MTGDGEMIAKKSMAALRRYHQAGTLSPLATAVLDELDSDWAMPATDRRWRENAAAWGLYLRRHGRRPSLSGGANESRLARWEARQRQAHAAGELTTERQRLVLAIEAQELTAGS